MAALVEEELLRRRKGSRLSTGEGRIGNGPPITLGDRVYMEEVVAGYLQSPYAQAVEDFRRVRNGSVLSAFQKTELFSQTYAYASNRVEHFGSEDDCFRWSSGHLFSTIAWFQLASHAPEGFVILPEEDTLGIAKKIGGIRTIENQVGGEMGDSKYIPDGAMVDGKGKIVTVFEHTLSTDYAKFISQSSRFRHFRNDLGEVANGANLTFVVPSTPREELDRLKARLNKELKGNGYSDINVDINDVPFTRNNFYQLLAYLIRTHRLTKGAPTIRERILERERLMSGISISKQARRHELAIRLELMFSGDTEAAIYVAKHSPKHEKPVPNAENVWIITTP